MKRLIFVLSLLLLTPNIAFAATPSPTKSPSKSPSPTAKTTAKTSAKPTVSSTSKVTAKPTVKATTKKKIVYKPRPKVSLSPSPTPKWPPAGFQSDKTTPDIYAKFPTRKELIGYTTPSTKTAAQLRTQLVTCESYVCGVLLAASQAGCNWWEFNTDVYGPTSDTDNTEIKYGSITALYGSSSAKQVSAYLLVSEMPLQPNYHTGKIQIACHREPIPTDLKVPSNTYTSNK